MRDESGWMRLIRVYQIFLVNFFLVKRRKGAKKSNLNNFSYPLFPSPTTSHTLHDNVWQGEFGSVLTLEWITLEAKPSLE